MIFSLGKAATTASVLYEYECVDVAKALSSTCASTLLNKVCWLPRCGNFLAEEAYSQVVISSNSTKAKQIWSKNG